LGLRGGGGKRTGTSVGAKSKNVQKKGESKKNWDFSPVEKRHGSGGRYFQVKKEISRKLWKGKKEIRGNAGRAKKKKKKRRRRSLQPVSTVLDGQGRGIKEPARQTPLRKRANRLVRGRKKGEIYRP